MAAAGAAAIAMYAATAMAAAAAAYSADAANKQAKAQSKQSEINAEQVQSRGRVEAERIRDAGRKQASAARANMAASGLDLSANNTITDVVEKEIVEKSSQDAWNSVFSSNKTAEQFQADAVNFKGQARDAVVGGTLQVGSTALSGYSNAKTAQKKGWS